MSLTLPPFASTCSSSRQGSGAVPSQRLFSAHSHRKSLRLAGKDSPVRSFMARFPNAAASVCALHEELFSWIALGSCLFEKPRQSTNSTPAAPALRHFGIRRHPDNQVGKAPSRRPALQSGQTVPSCQCFLQSSLLSNMIWNIHTSAATQPDHLSYPQCLHRGTSPEGPSSLIEDIIWQPLATS